MKSRSGDALLLFCAPLAPAPRAAASAAAASAAAAAASPLRAAAIRMKRPRSPRAASAAAAAAAEAPVRLPAAMCPSEPPASRARRCAPASSPPPSPHPPPPPPAVALTPLEARLFRLLRAVAADASPQPTLRVAGGWVRDKLLPPPAADASHNTPDAPNEPPTDPDPDPDPDPHNPRHHNPHHLHHHHHVDIDIALDTMLGVRFAERINLYLEQHNLPHASVGLIQKNPDQSKHLETATMRVMDVCLDLVNLRTETYSHHSRIPVARIGTPHEDAMRRDLTINALFYNIHTAAIEDFTRRGLHDIHHRIIRTPLPPLTTLLDDPLRALRAIRFASRLNFRFDAPLFAACRDRRVHHALGAKVSRERISHEVDRVVACDNAPHAVGLLVELGLFPIVFRLPPHRSLLHDACPPADFPDHALGALLNLHTLQPPDNCAAPRKVVRYAALLSPLATLRCSHALLGKKRHNLPVAHYILRHELRLATKDVAHVCALHAAALDLQKLVHTPAHHRDRLRVGHVIRAAGPFWRSALQIALIMQIRPAKPEDTFATGMGQQRAPHHMPNECRTLVSTYRAFAQHVETMHLDGVWDIKPAVDGNQLLKLLPRLKKGPLIGTIMKQQIDWMIQFPHEDTTQISERILEKYTQYR